MDAGRILVDGLRAAVGVPAAAYALAGIGLNVHFGYTGLLNFGQVAFMMVGAYGTAITVDKGGPFWLALIVGVVAAVVLGLVLGLPTLRLRADYLAIVTIAMAEILRLVARTHTAEGLTHGVQGIVGFAKSFYDVNPIPKGRYGVGDLVFSERTLWVIVVGWALVAILSVVVLLLARSPWGRVLRAVREDEDAARSLGKNVFGYKLQSLVIGGVIGATAGMLLAIDQQSVNPDTFVAVLTFYAYIVVILGGPATPFGPIAGAAIFWFLFQASETFLGQLIDTTGVTFFSSSDISGVRIALVGVGLMALMVFRPQGIFGNRRELALDDR